MARPSRTFIISHWYHHFENLQMSPLDFYAAVERAIESRQVPDAVRSRVDWREGGVFSAKREYLRVRRHVHIFDICGAPFGNGFFVSWWLGEPMGCLFVVLTSIPLLGLLVERLLRPHTYYQIDTALMFQEVIRESVNEVVDQLTTAKGLRALSELERKPILHGFYGR